MTPHLRERLINILLVLLIIIAALFLAQMLWQVFSGYADLILLFVLGWLVSFVLGPLVHQLSERRLPIVGFQLSRTAAVILVYLVLVLVMVLAVALLAPTAIIQLTQLARQLPDYMDQIPEASGWAQSQLAQLGVRINVGQVIDGALNSLQNYATAIIQNALSIFTSVLGLLANLFFVLIIGFIMTMDGPVLWQTVLNRVPKNFYDEVEVLSQNVDRTFGGFLRGQLIQALLVGAGTAAAMTVLGLGFVLVASLFAGLFMLIPLVGPFLALIPPVLAALFQSPQIALWLFIGLFIYQFVIVNMLMPRVLSDALGLHPLLVFAAILIGVRIAGFWGAFFGIPVVGVLWAMAVFFFERWQRDRVTSATRAEEMD